MSLENSVIDNYSVTSEKYIEQYTYLNIEYDSDYGAATYSFTATSNRRLYLSYFFYAEIIFYYYRR